MTCSLFDSCLKGIASEPSNKIHTQIIRIECLLHLSNGPRVFHRKAMPAHCLPSNNPVVRPGRRASALPFVTFDILSVTLSAKLFVHRTHRTPSIWMIEMQGVIPVTSHHLRGKEDQRLSYKNRVALVPALVNLFRRERLTA